ncbi:MAG: SLBB domain-containing protein [Candidatus Krumholzibacteria bacterium]|nr:SLBB domain-containing protein [Candidatus Krumholzibacteria bacterium]
MKSIAERVLIVFFVVLLAAQCVPAAAAGSRDPLKQRKILGNSEQAAEESETVAAPTQATSGVPGSQLPILERAIDPDAYVLGPYDEIGVTIMGTEPRTFQLNVLPEGDVLVPDVGPVHADGLTLTEFRRALSDKVNMYFRNVEIYCYLEAPALFRVFVTGAVEKPGVVAVSGVERVTDAIEKAGGVRGGGSTRRITLERGGELIRIDILRFLLQGDLKNNPFLRSGDRVQVPPAGARAVITGQVKRAGTYEIVEGESISDLIELAGGFTIDALDDSVLLTRVEGGRVSVSSIAKTQFDMPLRDQDEIGIFDRLKWRRYVQVEGATLRTGRFLLAPGEGIADLIVRAGGLESSADRSAAYVQKRDGKTVKVDLKDYLSPEPTTDVALEDGDVLTIPSMRRTVTVGGEVNEPGEFPYNGSMTIVQYIGLAGGPSENGSVNRVVIYSSDGRTRGVDRNDHPSMGDVIIVKKSSYKIFGDFFSGVIRIGTIVVSILILNK